MNEFKKCVCGNYVSTSAITCQKCGLRFFTGRGFYPEKENTMVEPIDKKNTLDEK